MRTTKTDQTAWMNRLIGVFIGHTSEGVFSGVGPYTPLIESNI